MTVDLCTSLGLPVHAAAGTHAADAPEGVSGSSAATGPPPAASEQQALHCVQLAGVVGHRADRLGRHVPVEHVAAEVRRLPDARIGFAGVDPTAGQVRAQLDQAVDLGMHGIVLSPADQGIRPTDDRFEQTVELARERGLVLLVRNPALRTPRSRLAFADHALLDEVIAGAAGAIWVLGDLGLVPVETTLLLLAKHEGVFAEISAVVRTPARLRSVIRLANELGVTERLLFASGYPDELPERAIARIYSVNALDGVPAGEEVAVPREVLRRIVEGDALGKLGIDHLWAGRPGAAGTPRREADRPALGAPATT